MAAGLKIVGGDFVINASGKVEIVQQTDKCTRDFGKMLVTRTAFAGNETSFDRYNKDYGTELENKSLYFGLSRMAVRDVVIGLLNSAIKRYIALQETRDNLDIGEIVTNVNFEVFYDSADLRNLIIDIKFTTAQNPNEISVGQFNQPIQ
jgi:hypothetical protein